MNAGAYGGEIKDVLVAADALDRGGARHVRRRLRRLGLSYRHCEVARGLDLRRGAGLRGGAGDAGPTIGRPHGRDPGGARGVAADPRPHRRLDLRQPARRKAWELIDAAGCRGLRARRRDGVARSTPIS